MNFGSPSRSTCLAVFLVLVLGVACAPGPPEASTDGSTDGSNGAAAEARPSEVDAEHVAAVEAWRAKRDASLRKEDGWLSLVGLFWLDEGANSFGSGPDNDLVFPAGTIAEAAGVLRRTGQTVELEPAEGVELTVDGEAVEGSRELVSDVAGADYSRVEHGSLLFYVIERGELVGIRLKDSQSRALAEFTGMESFPIDPSWRIEADYEPYDEPRSLRIPNILGTSSEAEILGAVSFERDGQRYVLQGTGSPETWFFLVFGDETNGVETYGAGRFVYTEPVREDGKVMVDFNVAYNPPCVFTPFATCPLPPPENKLPIRIEAGETSYQGH